MYRFWTVKLDSAFLSKLNVFAHVGAITLLLLALLMNAYDFFGGASSRTSVLFGITLGLGIAGHVFGAGVMALEYFRFRPHYKRFCCVCIAIGILGFIVSCFFLEENTIWYARHGINLSFLISAMGVYGNW